MICLTLLRIYYINASKSIKELNILQILQVKKMMRSFSQNQKFNMQERLNTVRNLCKLLEYEHSYNVIHTLFGYLIGGTSIPLNDRLAYDLKKQFNNIQQLFFERILSAQSIVFIVVDLLENYKMSQQSNQYEKFKKIITLTQQNVQETMTNERFITDKWKKQNAVELQNRKNELAFKKFLEQEKNQNKMKAEEAEKQGWQCQVCFTQIERQNFGLLQCGHIFHPQCINAYLKTKIEANQVEISCPMEGCMKLLEVGDIYGFIDGGLRQKYQKFSFNKFVQKNGASTSWCPTAGCQAAFEFDKQLDNYRCPVCKKHYCLRCRCQYHIGMTCAAYKVNSTFSKSDEDFMKFVQGAKFKQCPNCKFWVERTAGCSSMACKCGIQFCYDCGGTGCPHGSCANSGRNKK